MSDYYLTKKAWAILVHAAAERRTLTYTELAERLGGAGEKQYARFVNKVLRPIQDYCDQHDLPRLNDLVVSKQSDWPSYDPGPGYDFVTARKNVFDHDWSGLTVTMNDFYAAEAAAKAMQGR